MKNVFNSIGVNTRGLTGCLCKSAYDPYRFYGVFNSVDKDVAERHKMYKQEINFRNGN
jgi:hypothetical protein